jgi:hypothetical protein
MAPAALKTSSGKAIVPYIHMLKVDTCAQLSSVEQRLVRTLLRIAVLALSIQGQWQVFIHFPLASYVIQ